MEAEDFVGPGGVQEDSLVVEGTPPTYHAPLPIPQRITEPTGNPPRPVDRSGGGDIDFPLTGNISLPRGMLFLHPGSFS